MVVEECLTHAVETGAMWGIWVGSLQSRASSSPRSAPRPPAQGRPWLPQGAARHSHTLHCPRHLRRGPVRAALIRPRSMRGATMSSHEVCARRAPWRQRREFERRLEQHREHVLLVERVRLHVR